MELKRTKSVPVFLGHPVYRIIRRSNPSPNYQWIVLNCLQIRLNFFIKLKCHTTNITLLLGIKYQLTVF